MQNVMNFRISCISENFISSHKQGLGFGVRLGLGWGLENFKPRIVTMAITQPTFCKEDQAAWLSQPFESTMGGGGRDLGPHINDAAKTSQLPPLLSGKRLVYKAVTLGGGGGGCLAGPPG